jgi:4-amino-4-deoxy-L-arabinose transferase-like glycosyltransferase
MYPTLTSEQVKRYTLALQVSITAALVALWTFLARDSLLNSDDVLYAQMARESFESGRFMDHSWMGVTLFEKPPLLLWLLQLSGATFGFSDAAMRLPAALGAALTVVYTFKVARHLHGDDTEARKWPWIAGALLLSSWTFADSGGRVMTDTLLSASVMAMVYYALRMEKLGGRAGATGLGLAAGLGFMAKSFALGPAALVVACFLGWRRRWKGLFWSVGIAALLVLPWHVLMSVRHGVEFWEVYVGYHVLGRAEGIAVGSHGQDYYVSEMVGTDPVVAVVLFLGFLGVLFQSIFRRDQKLVLPLSVAVVGLIFLHASQTKFLHYLLPYIPLMAVVAVIGVSRLPGRKLGFGLMVCGILLSAVGYSQTEPHASYRPELRVLAEAYVLPSPPETRIVAFNEYAPAFFYYGEKVGEIWTDSERFYSIQQSIDMMRRSGIVHMATDEGLNELRQETRGMILIAPHRPMESQVKERQENPMSRVLQRLLSGFYSDKRDVSWHREASHLIVTVGRLR